MIVQTIAFYLFSAVTVAAAVMVISARNPVHSVLFLILAFFNAAGLFVLMGAEFIAMVLVIVYVGAVAVLFLFVVMMLDINFVELRQGFLQYLPIGALIGIVLMAELVLVFAGWTIAPEETVILASPTPPAAEVTNTHALGKIPLHRLHLRLPGGRGDPADRDDRRHRAHAPRPRGGPQATDRRPAQARPRGRGRDQESPARERRLTWSVSRIT